MQVAVVNNHVWISGTVLRFLEFVLIQVTIFPVVLELLEIRVTLWHASSFFTWNTLHFSMNKQWNLLWGHYHSSSWKETCNLTKACLAKKTAYRPEPRYPSRHFLHMCQTKTQATTACLAKECSLGWEDVHIDQWSPVPFKISIQVQN